MPRALIADDHESNVYLLRSLLEANGYDVVAAADGRSALDEALRRTPDIIISDILMPVMDGFAFCRHCRQDDRLAAVPFVFYTATYTDPRDEQLALSLGANLFLVKPTEPAEFLARISDVLRQCRAGRVGAGPSRSVDEVTYLREYNQALVRKLEDKVAALEEANRALRLKDFAIESATSGIVLTDLAGHVTYANPAMAVLCGRPREDLAGRRLGELFAGDAVSGSLSDAQSIRADWSGELSWQSSGAGEVRVVNCAIHTVRDPEGRPIGRMASFDDVTERKRMAEEMQRSQRLASLSLFAAGTAHDFNNLLTGLFGNIELARCALAPDSPESGYLDTARVAFERARDLTRRLLTFAKGEPLSRKHHSPLDLVQGCCTLSLVGSSVRPEIVSVPNIWPVLGDSNQLSQVFTNVLVNARQAMPQGGRVRIALENRELRAAEAPDLAPGRYVQVTFDDEGPGIPAAVLPHIFDPLFTTKPDGAGLGLAVCYSLVQAHGGWIEAGSSASGGARFRVLLPAGTGTPAVEPERAQPAAAPAGPRVRVLLMDDERPIRDMAKRMLARGGCEVVCVADGTEAIDACEGACRAGTPFDVAILDITVPGGMGGRDTLRHLTRRYPDLAVVLSSGYAEDAVADDDCRPAGFLPKPYQMNELLSCVRAATKR